LDFSQFGMIRGPSPLPETVDICEIGTFEHPDADYTTYQIKILLAWKYIVFLCCFYISASYVRFFLEVHNTNRGLPFSTMWFDSVLIVPQFACYVFIPGMTLAAIFQGGWFVGEPFIYIREFSMCVYGEIAHSYCYFFPNYILVKYLQLKGKDKLPKWTYIFCFMHFCWSFIWVAYCASSVFGILAGTKPPRLMMLMWVWVRGYSNKFEVAVFITGCLVWLIMKARQSKDPAGFQIVRPFWPLIIYTCINGWLQYGLGLHIIPGLKAMYPIEREWECYAVNQWKLLYAPIVVDGIKYRNSAGGGFYGDDVIGGLIQAMCHVAAFFTGPFMIRKKFLGANVISPIGTWFLGAYVTLMVLLVIVPWHLPHREDFETYFRVFMVLQWLTTAVILCLKKQDANYRSDRAVAGLVRLEERKTTVSPNVAHVQFYLPVFVSVLSNAIFVVSLITSPITPWKEESGLQSSDILGTFDFKTGIFPRASVTSLYFTVCIIYLVDHFMSISNVLFESVGVSNVFHPLAVKYRAFRRVMRFILFTVGSLPALRLILSGTTCETIDGQNVPVLMVAKTVSCNYYGYHLISIMFGFFIATWFVGFKNLRFASSIEETKRPFFSRYPASLVVENSSALLLVAIRSFNPDGAALAGIGLIVLLFNLGFYMTQWTFLQDARVIYFRCIAFAIIIDFYLCALFAQAGPNQWWPFILLIISLPFVIGGTYFVAKRRFENDERLRSIKDRRDMIVRALAIGKSEEELNANGSFSLTLSDLSDSDMGAALCTDRLQLLMPIVLKRNDNDSWENKDQANFLKDLERGYATILGLKSTDYENRIIPLLRPFLNPKAPDAFRSPAIKIVHRLHAKNVSLVKNELYDAIVKLFCFVDDAELHDLLADVIETLVGVDKICVYMSDENVKTSISEWAHGRDESGITSLQSPGRRIYFMPYHLLKKLTFEPRFEIFHMTISCPPQLMWEVDQFDTFNQAASLYIPQDAGVIKMDNVPNSSLSTLRPAVVRGKEHEIQYPKWRWVLLTADKMEKDFDRQFSACIYRFFSGIIPRWNPKEGTSSTMETEQATSNTKEISPEEDNAVNEIELETVNSQ